MISGRVWAGKISGRVWKYFLNGQMMERIMDGQGLERALEGYELERFQVGHGMERFLGGQRGGGFAGYVSVASSLPLSLFLGEDFIRSTLREAMATLARTARSKLGAAWHQAAAAAAASDAPSLGSHTGLRSLSTLVKDPVQRAPRQVCPLALPAVFLSGELVYGS
jgi:hypothetical protein